MRRREATGKKRALILPHAVSMAIEALEHRRMLDGVVPHSGTSTLYPAASPILAGGRSLPSPLLAAAPFFEKVKAPAAAKPTITTASVPANTPSIALAKSAVDRDPISLSASAGSAKGKSATPSSAATSASTSANLNVPLTTQWSTDFESTPGATDVPQYGYSLGNLAGQNNWSQETGEGETTTATVESSVVGSGAQAVQLTSHGTGYQSYDDFNSSDSALTASQISAGGGEVNVSFQMMQPVLAAGQTRSVGFGIDIFSANHDYVIASIYEVHDPYGDAYLLVTNGENVVDTIVRGIAGTPPADGTWDTYHLDMNFINNTFTVYVDANAQLSAYYHLNKQGTAEGGIGAVELATTADGTDSTYFDNVTETITTPPVVTAFSGLTAPQSIPYTTPTATFGGTIGLAGLFPPANEIVAVSLNGVVVNAPINSNGQFSATFNTSQLPPSSTPYAVAYVYAGDVGFDAVSDTSTTTLTITAASPDLSVINVSSVLDDTRNVTTTWQDDNSGAAAVNASFTDTVTLTDQTTDQTIAQQGLAYNETASGPIAAGASTAARQIVLAVPASVSTSDTLVATVVTDSGNVIAESNENNNSTSVNVTDLLPSYITTLPGAVFAWNSAANTLSLTSGTLTVTADPGTDEPVISVDGANSKLIFDPTSNATTVFHIAGLSLTDGASATITSVGSARNSASDRVLVIGESGATVAPLFNIDSTSTLDVTDNDVIDLYGSGASPYTTLRNDIAQAYDNAKWDHPGLTSSAAMANHSTYGLGYAEASALGLSNFDGIALGGNAVLLKYTLLGDTTLSGSVGLGNYNTVVGNFNSAQDWTGGNFHYGGNVGLGDYNDILGNFNKTLGVSVAIAASLSDDTGVSSLDSITSDPSIAGQLAGANPADFRAGLDSTPSSSYVSILSDVQSAGAFSLTPAQLAQINGGPLADGPHTLYLEELNSFGEPIVSQTVSFTLDTTPPASTVAALPAQETNSNFTVNWSGSDGSTGSGIAYYNVYVSVNGQPYTIWQQKVAGTSATYSGQPKSTYSFYSVATDIAGNVQATPTTAQATTLIAPFQPVFSGLTSPTTINYGNSTATFGGTISAGVNIPPSTETVAVSLNGVTINAPINAQGQFTATFNTASIPVSANPYSITYTYAGDSSFYSASNHTSTTLTVVPIWLSTTSLATWNPSTQTLTVTGPTAIIADPGTDEPIITASGSAAVITINPSSGTDIHLGGLSLSNGAKATVTSLGSARSVTNYRLLVLGTPGALVAPTYSIDTTSTLDLTDNDMAILYGSGVSPLSTVQSELSGAYDNKLWNMPGLTSSAAASSGGVTALGYGEAASLGLSTFDGLPLGGNAVLVKYTLVGDANLDGTVSLSDYNIVINNLNASGESWTSGSFDYSGNVSLGDYNAVTSNFNLTLADLLPGGEG